MTRLSILTVLVLVTAEGTHELPCEARVSTLEATVMELKAAVMELQVTLGQQGVQLAAALKELARDGSPSESKHVHHKVRVEAAGAGRFLSEADGVSIGARSWQTHFFPDGHSCPNLDSSRPKMLLPVEKDSSVSFHPHPSDLPADAHVSLVSVEPDWSTSEIQSFPNPFKIVHDASCSAAPTLELSLRTTVGGVDLGASLAILESLQAWSSQRGFSYAAPPPPPVAPLQASAATIVYIEASSSWDGNYIASKALDGNIATYWHTSNKDAGHSEYFYVQLDSPTAVAGYRFQARSGEAAESDAPHAWHFEASNDGVLYTELQTVWAEVGWSSLETRTYFVPPDAVAPFTYFRWFFPSDMIGSPGCLACVQTTGVRSFIVLTEVELLVAA